MQQQKNEEELILVETIQSFRMRYVVKVPKGKQAWALDSVVCEDAPEFSQNYIGEQIISNRIIDKKELNLLFKEDGNNFHIEESKYHILKIDIKGNITK